jgi:hypothetical protein
MKKIIFVFSILLAMSSYSIAQTSVSETGPVITFESTVYDYGTIKKEADGKCEFVFTNTGKEPLILSRPRSNCGCTVPTWPQEPIMPGQSEIIVVTYDTKRVGPINKQVTIMSNAVNSPVVLRITGTVSE